MKCPQCEFGAAVVGPMFEISPLKLLGWLLGLKRRVAGYICQCPNCGCMYVVDKAGQVTRRPGRAYGPPPSNTEEPQDELARRRRERDEAEAKRRPPHDDDLKFDREP